MMVERVPSQNPFRTGEIKKPTRFTRRGRGGGGGEEEGGGREGGGGGGGGVRGGDGGQLGPKNSRK